MRKTKTRFLILILLAALCLSACGGSASFSDVSSAVSDAVGAESLTAVDSLYIEGMIGLSADSYSEAEVKVTSGGTTIDEYGIFETENTAAVKEALEAYIQQRIDTWMGYTPEEFPKLENAEVTVKGRFVLYTILSDSAARAAKATFAGCFS